MITNRSIVNGEIIQLLDDVIILKALENSNIRLKVTNPLDVKMGDIVTVRGRLMVDELGCYIGKIREYNIGNKLVPSRFELSGIFDRVVENKLYITKLEGDKILTITVLIHEIEEVEKLWRLSRGLPIKILGKFFYHINNIYVIKAQEINYLTKNDQLIIVR